MRHYRRVLTPGGVYFFTVVLQRRKGNDLLVRHIDELREAFRHTAKDHPFAIDAVCILPDHLHCLWRLPEGDADYAMRWRLIKTRFSRAIPLSEPRNHSRLRRGERGIWQRRYWEHLIRDDRDFAAHMDYIHFNPVKHGHVKRAADWRYSSFRRWVERGVYAEDWAADPDVVAARWD